MLEKERRKDKRYSLENKIKYSAYNVFEQPVLKGSMSYDVSVGGLSFRSEKSFKKGSLLFLELNLPGWASLKGDFLRPQESTAFEPLKVLAQVTWTKKLQKNWRVGVEMVNVDPSHHKALKKFLKNIESDRK